MMYDMCTSNDSRNGWMVGNIERAMGVRSEVKIRKDIWLGNMYLKDRF